MPTYSKEEVKDFLKKYPTLKDEGELVMQQLMYEEEHNSRAFKQFLTELPRFRRRVKFAKKLESLRFNKFLRKARRK